MALRETLLWRPAAAGRLAILAAALALILLLSFLHALSGLAYEFHVFFLPPVVLVAWFLGTLPGFAVAWLAVGLWFLTDRLLDGEQAATAALLFNTGSRLAIYCAAVWMLVQTRRLLEVETRLARLDALTQLPNRHEFHERGCGALALARREQTAMTAVFIDLDRFKEINDRLGHAAGDALLRRVAALLKSRLRASDIAGRLGGDEFALLLPGMGGSAAHAYVENLRLRLLAEMAEHEWPVGFSIGVASADPAPADLDGLLAEADRLMYEVKRGGRNRVLHRQIATLAPG